MDWNHKNQYQDIQLLILIEKNIYILIYLIFIYRNRKELKKKKFLLSNTLLFI